MKKAFSLILLGLLLLASKGVVLDDPKHLPSWCLEIEERSIGVNHFLESEVQHLLLQFLSIIGLQFKPQAMLRLLIVERILCKLPAQHFAIREFECVKQLWRPAPIERRSCRAF